MSLDESVLVLNKNYHAIRVINAKRALVLIYKGIAEIIDVEKNKKFYNYDFESWQEISELKAEFEDDDYKWVKCVHNLIAIPTIIRLITYDRIMVRKSRLTRKALYTRDNNMCQYCGKKFPSQELSIDHIIPKSRGGRLTWENVVCSCIKCNVRKANRTPEEAKMHLIKKPKCPKDNLSSYIPASKHWSWQYFLDTAYWNTELSD